MRERKPTTKFSSLIFLFSLSTINAICFNKKPSGCGPNGAVFMSPVSCKNECKGFIRAKKLDAELLSTIDSGLATYSVAFKGKNPAPKDISYTGMFRFRTGCSQRTLELFDADNWERIQVIVSDRVPDAYTTEFVAHRIPKFEKQKNKESAVLQFSRKVTQGEKTKLKGDAFIITVAYDIDSKNVTLNDINSCIQGAQFWFMPKDDTSITESYKSDYTNCFLSKRYGEKIYWEETYQMPSRNMPKTKSCPNPVEPKDDEGKTKSRPKIAGGQETVKGRWPWFAWTSGTMSNYTNDNCGLTILTKNEDGSDDWLLTDEYCCYDNPRMLIHIGEWNLKEEDDSKFQVLSKGHEFTEDGYPRYCFVRVPNLINSAPRSCIENSCFEPVCLSINEPEDFTICYSAGFGAAGNLRNSTDYESNSYDSDDYYSSFNQYFYDYYNAPDQSYVLKDFPVYVENSYFHAIDFSGERSHFLEDPQGHAHCVGDAGSPFICIVDDLPVLTSIAYGDRWCQEMPQPIRRLPVEEIIQFVNNPPELFVFPDVDWEEPNENLTSGLICETPLDPVPAEPSPKIIGGSTVPIEHHPYIAWLGFCGGTLITMNDDSRDDFVVSAAHCCEVYEQYGVDILHHPKTTPASSTSTSRTRTSTTTSSTFSSTYSSTTNPWRTTSSYEDFQILLGTNDIEDLGECGQSIDVISYAIHHDYDYNFYDYNSEEPGIPSDICLIKIKNVKDEISRNGSALETCKRSISPACLPAEHVPEGSYCKVAGWGDGNNPYNLLHDIGLYTFSNEYCAGTDANDVTETEKYESQFCAGIPDFDEDGFIDGGKNVCYGDSGGPLVCEAFGKPVLYGAVSWGSPWCANDNHPGIYAKVSLFTDWILDFMN